MEILLMSSGNISPGVIYFFMEWTRIIKECLIYREAGRTFLFVNKLTIPRHLGRGSSFAAVIIFHFLADSFILLFKDTSQRFYSQDV